MTVKTSTGLRNKVMDTGSMKSRLTGMNMRLYSGAPPATADAAATGTLICTVTGPAGVGLDWEAAAVDGVLSKLGSQAWSGNNVAAGTIGYYRLVAPADDGTLSTTAERLQGSVGQAGADLNLTNPTVANGAPQPIDYFVVALPTA